MAGDNQGFVHVVAAAVTDLHGRVLIAQRPPGKAMAGNWEFPGGKVELGESRVQALARELNEELGITVMGQPRPLIRILHSYPFGDVLIDMWVVSRYEGRPAALDGQNLRWCGRDELGEVANFLAADKPILRALRLPERLEAAETSVYTIGSADKNRQTSVLSGVYCSTAEEGQSVRPESADFLVMCQPLSAAQLRRLCETTRIPVFARELNLESAWELGACGINTLPP